MMRTTPYRMMRTKRIQRYVHSNIVVFTSVGYANPTVAVVY